MTKKEIADLAYKTLKKRPFASRRWYFNKGFEAGGKTGCEACPARQRCEVGVEFATHRCVRNLNKFLKHQES